MAFSSTTGMYVDRQGSKVSPLAGGMWRLHTKLKIGAKITLSRFTPSSYFDITRFGIIIITFPQLRLRFSAKDGFRRCHEHATARRCAERSAAGEIGSGRVMKSPSAFSCHGPFSACLVSWRDLLNLSFKWRHHTNALGLHPYGITISHYEGGRARSRTPRQRSTTYVNAGLDLANKVCSCLRS
jgi:hypothetical protein